MNGIKMLVVWNVQDDSVITEAYEKYGIIIAFMGAILESLISKGWVRGSRDDILRTIELISIHENIRKPILKREQKRRKAYMEALLKQLTKKEGKWESKTIVRHVNDKT